jgi:tetratricopeptide (TPR) repeat protein
LSIPAFLPFLNAQTWNDDMVIARKMVDSLKNELKNAEGTERVDCLNMLSDCYLWIWDDNDKHLDSACLYANQAYSEAKKLNYKRGLGYGLLLMADCSVSRVDNNKSNNNSEQNYLLSEQYAQEAIKIGEEIKDYRLVGDGYGQLKGIEKRKGNLVKSKTYLQKQILCYEKPVTKPLKGLLNIATCKECQGNEILLGNRYRELAVVVVTENKGNFIAANDQIEKAIYYYTMTGRKAALGTMFSQFAETVSQAVDLETGIIPFKKAIEQFHESGNKNGEFDAHMRVCRNYWNMGDFENGFSYCKKGIALAMELSKGKSEKENDYRLGEAYYWMSRHYLIAGDFESALYFIKKTKPFYQDGNRKIVWATAIGGVYRSMGNIDSAQILPASSWNKISRNIRYACRRPGTKQTIHLAQRI